MRVTDTHIYFWGSIYSNFQACTFTIGNNVFNCSEQAFMYFKATHFNDDAIAEEIMATAEPKDQKALGKLVRGFSNEEWEKVRYQYMLTAVLAKFSQNENLKQFLVATGNKVFVEASPYDKVWGVGLREDDPLILDESNWQGLNLLGQVLMDVRAQLRQQK